MGKGSKNHSPNFEQIFNGIPGAFLVLSSDLNLIAISDELQLATNTKREEIVGHYVFDVLSDDPNNPSGFKIWKASLEKVLRTGESDIMPVIKYSVKSDETEGQVFTDKYWRPGNFPIFDSNGKIQYIIHRTEEISELQKIQQESREGLLKSLDAEARMKFALAAAEMGDWELNLITGQAYCSLKHDQCFGYTEAQSIWTLDHALRHVHPEDRDMVEQKHLDAMNDKGEMDFECRILWVDGSLHWIRVRARTEKDLANKPIRLTGIVWDITDEKMELEKTAQSEQEFVNTLESMSDCFFSLDQNWRVTRVNRPFELLVEMSRDDLIGKSLIELWFNEKSHQDSTYLKAYRKAMSERVPVTFVDYDDSLESWKEVRVNPKSDGGIAVFFTDITDDKTAQIKYESSVDVSPAILWITEIDGSCTYLSQRWYEFTGQTSEQALGFGWLEATHPDDKQKTAEIYLTANASQKPFYAECRLKTKSGQYRWAINAGNPRFDSHGNYLGYAGTVFDIHDQKVAAEAIETLNYRFLRSAQAADLGVWYCDLPFDILIWNDEVKRHFFLPPEAHVTIDLFYERIHPEDREPTRLAIQAAIESKSSYDTIYRTTNPMNPTEIKSIRAVGWTDYNHTGKPTRFDGITIDVTLEFHRRAELVAAKNEAERANELKSSFLANMSHEIRTPLGAILGFSDLLKDNTIRNEERVQFLDTISRNGRALTKIIDDILDLAKVESGKLEVEHTEFSLFDLVDDVMDLFRERTKAKSIYLRAHLESETPGRIISDPTRLRQILINIVGNAVKFTNEGGVNIEVKGLKQKNSNIILEVIVKDTGVGMTDEQRRRIFQPFMQADNTMTRKFGGTGLGLALSKRLANALKGDIFIRECGVDQGSTFVISFLANLPTSTCLQQANIEETQPEQNQALFGIRVLVADDSQDNLFLVSRILKKQGALVETASNGSEAFQKGMSGLFDIILMDIQMPEMDGYDATRSLRKAGFKKPVIALTAHAMAEERDRSMAAGCNGHLTKPLNQQELIETIRKIVPIEKEEKFPRDQ